MRAKTEAPFKMQVLKFLNEQERCVVFSKEAGAIRGLPDIMGTWGGYFIAFEIKKDAQGLESSRASMQQYWITKFNKAKGIASFLYPENAEEVLTALANEMFHRGVIGLDQHSKAVMKIELLFKLKEAL